MNVLTLVKIKNEKNETEKRVRAKSFVQGLIDCLFSHFSQGSFTVKDVEGNDISVIPSELTFALNADSGDDNFGILVGTGTDAISIADYKLKNKISHGSGTGQLSYGTNDISQPSTFGNSRQITISRTLTNNSPSAITINEVGLVAKIKGSDENEYYVLLERTLLQFVIASGSNKTVSYIIRVSV